MSFLKRLRDRRHRAQQQQQNEEPLDQTSSSPATSQEIREGPLAEFGGESGIESVVDLGQANGSWSQSKQKSRLSKTTIEVLHDQSALAYLIQYLEARDAVQLVKFWLDVESFRCSASTVITSSYVPPQVSRERLDMVPESTAEADYDEAESVCSDTDHRLPENSTTDSFDSGLDTRSDFTMDLSSPSSSSSSSVPSLSTVQSYAHADAHLRNNGTTSAPSPIVSPSKCVTKGRAEQILQTRAEDAVKIYRRYIAPECLRPVHLPTEYKRQIVERICAEEGHVAADCFDDAQERVVVILDTEYFPDFLNSQFHAKHQVDVLTSGDVAITDILYNDTALFHFMEFMEGMGQREVMEFWLAATNFSQSFEEGRSDCQADAMVLYEKFISMQATSPLGFHSSVRLQVEDMICRQEGPDITCFYLPLQLVQKYLEEKYLHSFLQSSLFNCYVKELLGTIQATPRSMSNLQDSMYSSSARSCRTESDTRSSCSSDFSYDRGDGSVNSHVIRRSSSNTLLASSSGSKLIKNLDRSSMNFDCKELQDPDSIWKRRPVRNKVGRVNSFGRYEPGLDLAPEMNRDEVAEMIVRDVTSVTMPEKEKRRNSTIIEEKDKKLLDENNLMRKSRSETVSLKKLSMELPTAKYF